MEILVLLAIVIALTIGVTLLCVVLGDWSAIVLRRTTKRIPPPPEAPKAEPATFGERVSYIHQHRKGQITDSSWWIQARAFHEVFGRRH